MASSGRLSSLGRWSANLLALGWSTWKLQHLFEVATQPRSLWELNVVFLSFMMIETLRVLKVSAPRAAIKQKFHGMLRTYGSPGVLLCRLRRISKPWSWTFMKGKQLVMHIADQSRYDCVRCLGYAESLTVRLRCVGKMAMVLECLGDQPGWLLWESLLRSNEIFVEPFGKPVISDFLTSNMQSICGQYDWSVFFDAWSGPNLGGILPRLRHYSKSSKMEMVRLAVGGSTGSGVCLSFRCSKSPDAPLPLAVRAKVILTCSDSLYIYIYTYI